MDELDDLDKIVVQVLRESGVPHNQYTLAENPVLKQGLNTLAMYDKWWILLGRLKRLEAKDYVVHNVETNQYSYK